MMTILQLLQTSVLQLQDHVTYPEHGLANKVLWRSQQCQASLLCLPASTKIAEHSSDRHATIQVLEGTGFLTLKGTQIPLSPGVFVLMVAHDPHALEATSNLAFVLTLSTVD